MNLPLYRAWSRRPITILEKEIGMNESALDTMARRLDRVERENRRIKGAGVVVLVAAATVVLMGQTRGGQGGGGH